MQPSKFFLSWNFPSKVEGEISIINALHSCANALIAKVFPEP